jgi:hypothetical protein
MEALEVLRSRAMETQLVRSATTKILFRRARAALKTATWAHKSRSTQQSRLSYRV